MPAQQELVIADYEDAFSGQFASLNRGWLEEFGMYEKADDKQLYSPRKTILNQGGAILIARKDQCVQGTCALIRASPTVFEMAKLSVAVEARRTGLGRRLAEAAIDRAESLGAERLTLLSSSRLMAALHLYESLGFRRKTIPADQPYERADVYMELSLLERAGSQAAGIRNNAFNNPTSGYDNPASAAGTDNSTPGDAFVSDAF